MNQQTDRASQRDRILAEPRIRVSKRERIVTFFSGRLGVRYASPHLHAVFGTSFRARISEINADQNAPIHIFNETRSTDSGETSVYWSEVRSASRPLFPYQPERHRDDN